MATGGSSKGAGRVDAPIRDLVGRVRERVAIAEALSEAVAGQRRIVVVSGEAGIGKTRLALHAAALATESGALVLRGRCWSDEGAPTLWPWREMSAELTTLVGAHLGDSAPASRKQVQNLRRVLEEPERDRFPFLESASAAFTALSRERPLMLLLDDAHAADGLSLMLLRHLGLKAERARILLVVTRRDDMAYDDRASLLAEIERSAVRLPLQGLSRSELAELSALLDGPSDPGAVTRIHRATDGNPFYAEEIFRAMRDTDAAGRPIPIPQTVRQAVALRLRPLPPSAGDVLGAAAVLGQEFDARELVVVLEQDPAPVRLVLDRGRAAGILKEVLEQPGRWRFSHPLYSEVLYEGLTSERRSQLHLSAAVAIEACGSSHAQDRVVEIAHHRFHALPSGSPAQAVRALLVAGDEAMRLLAFEDAADYFGRALTVMTADEGQAARCDVQLSLGSALWRAGQTARAREIFGKAADLARRMGSKGHLARAALGLGSDMVIDVGIVDEPLVQLLRESLLAVGNEPHLRAMLLARLAVELYWASPGLTAESPQTLIAAAMQQINRAPNPLVEAHVLQARHLALWSPDNLDARLADAERMLALAEQLGDQDLLLIGRFLRLADKLEQGDMNAVRAEISAADQSAGRLRQPYYQWGIELTKGMYALLQGRLGDAEQTIQDSFAMGQVVAPQSAFQAYAVQLSVLRREQGRVRELEPMIQGLATQYVALPGWRCALTYLLTELGRLDEAATELDVLAVDEFAGMRRDLTFVVSCSLLAMACRALDDAERASILYELLLPYAGRTVVPAAPIVCYGPVAFYLALLAWTAGRHDDALRFLAQAETESARIGALPHLAHTRMQRGRLLLEMGDRAAAAASLNAAATLFRRLEMTSFEDAAAAAGGGTGPGHAGRAVLKREGDYWAVGLGGQTVRVRDSRGLRCLAILLAHPGTEIHVLDLAARTGPGGAAEAAQGSDAGPMIDDEARDAYRRRLEDLRDEEEEATNWGDPSRAARARAEIEILSRELGAALNRSGKGRRAASSAERARVNMTKAIRASIERIEQSLPDLGKHLRDRVRTGAYCSYHPETSAALTWEV